jgi:hypothetical protein
MSTGVNKIIEIYCSMRFHRSFLLDTHCELCKEPCATCNNITSCLTCPNKFNLLNDQCIEKCPDGYYLSNKICMSCNSMCGTCIGKRIIDF